MSKTEIPITRDRAFGRAEPPYNPPKEDIRLVMHQFQQCVEGYAGEYGASRPLEWFCDYHADVIAAIRRVQDWLDE